MSRITKVKICGIRRSEDVQIINKYLPAYAGFVFAKSKRQVSSSQFYDLVKNLDSRIIPVGVFVNHPILEIKKAIDKGLKIIQLHGDEDKEYLNELKSTIDLKNIEIWKVIRINENKEISEDEYLDINRVLFDKYNPKEYGGTGETFNWEILLNKKIEVPFILAGGLTVDNVKDALKVLNPYCVDLSSGVEIHGIKDEEKIKEFINTVRK